MGSKLAFASQLTEFGSELHPLLFVHVVQDGVLGLLPDLGLPPPEHRQTDRQDVQCRCSVRQTVWARSIVWCSPPAAADEGPADGQDEDHEREAGQDDVQDPPL